MRLWVFRISEFWMKTVMHLIWHLLVIQHSLHLSVDVMNLFRVKHVSGGWFLQALTNYLQLHSDYLSPSGCWKQTGTALKRTQRRLRKALRTRRSFLKARKRQVICAFRASKCHGSSRSIENTKLNIKSSIQICLSASVSPCLSSCRKKFISWRRSSTMRCRPRTSWIRSASMTGRTTKLLTIHCVKITEFTVKQTCVFPCRNATNRLDKLVKELDKEVRMDRSCSSQRKMKQVRVLFHSHSFWFPLWSDEQQAESGGLAQAAGERASSAAAPERRQPAQGGDWNRQKTWPGERAWVQRKYLKDGLECLLYDLWMQWEFNLQGEVSWGV